MESNFMSFCCRKTLSCADNIFISTTGEIALGNKKGGAIVKKKKKKKTLRCELSPKCLLPLVCFSLVVLINPVYIQYQQI